MVSMICDERGWASGLREGLLNVSVEYEVLWPGPKLASVACAVPTTNPLVDIENETCERDVVREFELYTTTLPNLKVKT